MPSEEAVSGRAGSGLGLVSTKGSQKEATLSKSEAKGGGLAVRTCKYLPFAADGVPVLVYVTQEFYIITLRA